MRKTRFSCQFRHRNAAAKRWRRLCEFRRNASGLTRVTRFRWSPPDIPGVRILVNALLNDIHGAARSFLKAKGFTATVLLTLALAIGVNTATFAIVNSVLLRPLPVPESDRILLMSNQYPKAGVPHND